MKMNIWYPVLLSIQVI